MLTNQVNPQNNIVASQSAIQMDGNQHMQLQQAAPAGGRRRKRAEGAEDDGPSASEPRRLRRSHEACARCRSKKIKASPVGRDRRQFPWLTLFFFQCDSKHPRCTACATAGTACNQEDRHRRTLTPRGYTERLELQLAQCEALLKRRDPAFNLDDLDAILAREGIEVGLPPLPQNPAFQIDPSNLRSFRPDQPSQQPPKGYSPMYPPAPPHMMHPPYGPPMMPPYGAPPYHPHMMQPPGPYPHLHPAFQPPGAPYPPPPPPPPPVMHQHQAPPPEQPVPATPQPPQPMSPPIMRSVPTKGTDPNGHDMSSAQALAKNFGVSDVITSGLKLDSGNEELPVDPNALPKLQVHGPRDASHWITVSIRNRATSANTLSLYGPISKSPQVDVWLPKDRVFAQYITDVYFKNLNLHRPVYSRKDFDKILNDLYEGVTPSHDPGHLCSVYLIFALGTLSELNQRAVSKSHEKDQYLGSAVAKELMPPNWPVHDEFFERALAVKPDLRVSLSSLQALILLHWYLYIEVINFRYLR